MSARLATKPSSNPRVTLEFDAAQLVTLRKGLIAFRHLAPNAEVSEIEAAMILEDDLTTASCILAEIGGHS